MKTEDGGQFVTRLIANRVNIISILRENKNIILKSI